MGKRGVPSWELAYLPLRHVWRWFSSSQGEICYFPGRYPGIQELIWRSEVLIAGFNSDFYFSCNTTFPFWSLGERFWVCEAFLQWYLEAYSLLLMDQLIVISSRGLWSYTCRSSHCCQRCRCCCYCCWCCCSWGCAGFSCCCCCNML